MLLEFELEFELELLLELLLWLELELELELLLELLLWLELELLLWFELELELELLLWFELEFLLWRDLASAWRAKTRFWLLIVRRFATARARHHSIGFPSIFRSTVTRAGLSEIGATVPRSSFDRAEMGSRAAPTAIPMAPSAPA